MSGCPIIGRLARQLQDDGESSDDEPSLETGSANIFCFILLSISFLSAIVVLLCALAIYHTDPIFAIAISSPVSIISAIAAVIIFKKTKDSSVNNNNNEYNKRDNPNCFYTIHAVISKNRARQNASLFDVCKSSERKHGYNKGDESNKDQESANYLKHTEPPRGK
jgi:glucan phosphoethanolaminetransferase (alkaline phosphatase superfamily)